jgi:hypothetical protein
MHDCTHPAPIPFGTMDVSWAADGLAGVITIECRDCGDRVTWAVEEE